MEKQTRKITLDVPNDLYEFLKKSSEKEGISINDFVVRALRALEHTEVNKPAQ